MLKAMTLWTVADEDLLQYLCCAELAVSADNDGFVGGDFVMLTIKSQWSTDVSYSVDLVVAAGCVEGGK